jgi:hypothetical protein
MPRGKGPYGRIWTNDNVDEMQKRVDEYFEAHPGDERPPTMGGLARALGCSNVQTMHQWALNTSNGVQKVADVVNGAVAIIRERYETLGLLHKGNPAFMIFGLKQPIMGYTDRQDLNVEGVDTFLADLNKAIRNKEGNDG